MVDVCKNYNNYELTVVGYSKIPTSSLFVSLRNKLTVFERTCLIDCDEWLTLLYRAHHDEPDNNKLKVTERLFVETVNKLKNIPDYETSLEKHLDDLEHSTVIKINNLKTPLRLQVTLRGWDYWDKLLDV